MEFEPFYANQRSTSEPFLAEKLTTMPISKPSIKTRVIEQFTKQFIRCDAKTLLNFVCIYVENELLDIQADPTLPSGDVVIHVLNESVLTVDVRLYSPGEPGSIMYGHSIRRLSQHEFLINTYGCLHF
ncbi:hypothetical protein [Kordiimonas sp.]|uniref:hypothetical protein n=1 Tax=Kordiimonas sp. TaxID=1970157 RepID=UPI003A955978